MIILATASFVFVSLLFTGWVLLKIFEEQKANESIATITQVEGDVLVIQGNRRLKAYIGLPIYKFNRLQTATDSKATLNFVTGDKIRFLQNSEVNFKFWDNENNSWPLFAHIRRGQFEHLKAGNQNQLVVETQEGIPTIIGKAPILSQKGIHLEESEVKPQDPKKSSLAGTSLRPNNKEIVKKVRSYLNQLQKCQLSAFGNNQVAKGQLIIGFSIFPKGKTGDINILNSDTKSKQLDVCVKSVFERMTFSQFNGDPIVVNFPLKFE